MAVHIRYFKNYISKELEPSTTNETLKPLIITSTKNSSVYVVLPPGGKWAYVLIPSLMRYAINGSSRPEYTNINTIIGPEIGNLVGIASGGSTVVSFNPSVNGGTFFAGFTWRVA